MICPGCGNVQSIGGECQLCGTPFGQEGKGTETKTGRPVPKGSSLPQQKEKYRPRPLHDLDLTISLPGTDFEGRQLGQAGSRLAVQKTSSVSSIICTTTPIIEGSNILEYFGVISNVTSSALTDEVGREETQLHQKIKRTEANALDQLRQEASQLGANALVGITIQISHSPDTVWIHTSGTAVRIKST